MATRQTFAQEISRRARAIGWSVHFNSDGQRVITNTETSEFVLVPNTPSDRDASNEIMQRLINIGFDEAEQEWSRLHDEDRLKRLTQIQQQNQEFLDRQQNEADQTAMDAEGARFSYNLLTSPFPVPKTFERVLVTPELANRLLDLNTGNRPIREKEITGWMTTIESGNWRYTHQGAAVDSNGVLQDGQHRLSAILRSGIPCEMQISIGMPPENFSAIDNGLKRTFGDVVAHHGYGARNRVGTAARLVIIYENYPRRALTSKVSNAELASFINTPFDDSGVEKNGDVLYRASNIAQLMWRSFRINASAATAGVYKLFDMVGEDNEKVQEFINGLINGDELSGLDARQVLRKYCNTISNRNRTAWAHLALFIKAWNKWVTDTPTKNLSMKRTEDLPMIIIFEEDDETPSTDTESSTSSDDADSVINGVSPVPFSG
jgi:hypothetical protein